MHDIALFDNLSYQHLSQIVVDSQKYKGNYSNINFSKCDFMRLFIKR